MSKLRFDDIRLLGNTAGATWDDDPVQGSRRTGWRRVVARLRPAERGGVAP